MPRTGVVTQARLGSSRLPGKVLLRAAGRTMLDHHLDRLLSAGLEVYLATTFGSADDPIAELASGRGVAVFRGSEEDVLSRYAGCAREFDLDVVVRVTSDCPLIDGQLVAEGVERFHEMRREHGDEVYLSNTLDRTYPRGLDFEIFAAEALLRADREATAPRDREHVTPWLYSGPHRLQRLVQQRLPVDRSVYRLTLDTVEDLTAIRRIVEDYQGAKLDCAGLVRLLDGHPEIVALNADVRQKPLA